MAVSLLRVALLNWLHCFVKSRRRSFDSFSFLVSFSGGNILFLSYLATYTLQHLLKSLIKKKKNLIFNENSKRALNI